MVMQQDSVTRHWNPSPPSSPTHSPPPRQDLELQTPGDKIGSTVFSKAWVLALLVKAVGCVSNSTEKDGEECVSNLSENRGESSKVVEVDESSKVAINGAGVLDLGIEEELCILWDASMNTEVAEFLYCSHGVDLLFGVAARTLSSRLKEISVGIVGNMACLPQVCSQCMCELPHIDQVLGFLEDEDPRVVIEGTRLMLCCLAHKETKKVWLEHIQESPEMLLQLLIFILQSSTNDDLLRNTASLLDQLLDESEELLNSWTGLPLMEAICEAAQQTSSSSPDVCGSLLLSLQLFTTINQGISSLVSDWHRVSAISLHHVCSLDHITPTNCRTALAAVSLLEAIQDHTPSPREDVLIGADSHKTLQRLLSEVCGGGEEEEEEVVEQISSLRRILSSLLSIDRIHH